jgi:hypothetical protein
LRRRRNTQGKKRGSRKNIRARNTANRIQGSELLAFEPRIRHFPPI